MASSLKPAVYNCNRIAYICSRKGLPVDVRISDAELEVMEALWSAGHPLTAAEVADRIGSPRGWSLATVKTMLSRLTAKGAVAHREDGRRFLYSPHIGRKAYVGHESRRFIDRLFGGRLSPLVARLAEEDALDR